MKIWSWIQEGFETVSRPEYCNSAWVLRTEYSFFNPIELQVDYDMTTLIAVSITTAMSHIKRKKNCSNIYYNTMHGFQCRKLSLDLTGAIL